MRAVNALAPPLPRRAPLRRSFAVVAEEHLNDVHRYLLMLTADHTLAEDLTAETFEKAFRSWRRYDPRRSSERTWLCRIGRNVALDHFRSEARRRRREDRYAVEQRAEARRRSSASRPSSTVRSPRSAPASARCSLSGSCSTSTPTPPQACSASAARRAPCAWRERSKSWKGGWPSMPTTDPLAPDRLEELLGGAVPEGEREALVQGLVRELRAGATVAPAPLRARVGELSEQPVRRPRVTPAAAHGAGAGVRASGGGRRRGRRRLHRKRASDGGRRRSGCANGDR